MEQNRYPVRSGSALALRAQALPPPSSARSHYAWLGTGLLLAAIAGIGFQLPVLGVLLAAACSLALLRTASKAQKQV